MCKNDGDKNLHSNSILDANYLFGGISNNNIEAA